jgi:predicted Zn-dependent protease
MKLALFFVAFVLTMVLPPTGWTADAKMAPSDQRAVHAAQQAMENGDRDGARRILSEHLKKRSGTVHPLVYHVLGNAFYLDGRVRDAYDAFRKGLDTAPDSRDLCLNLARSAVDLKRYREAGRLLERAYGLGKLADPDLLYEAGAAFYKAGAFGEARNVLQRLIRSRKSPETAWIELLLHTLLELKAFSDAETLMTDYLNRHPADPAYWQLLAQLRLQRENPAGAAAALEVAYAAEPPRADGWRELADLYLSVALPGAALRCMEKAYGPNPGPEACKKMAEVARSAHLPDRAVDYLDRAITQSPGAALFRQKGEIFYGQGQWEKAITAFQECLRMDPADGVAAFYLGHSALRSGDIEIARTAFAAAAESSGFRRQALEALEDLSEVAAGTLSTAHQ